MPKGITKQEQQLRNRLHEAMTATRDMLEDVGPPDMTGPDAAEADFAELATTIVHLADATRALRDVPGLSVDGALVAGSAETAIVVLRSTLANFHAALDAARDERAA